MKEGEQYGRCANRLSQRVAAEETTQHQTTKEQLLGNRCHDNDRKKQSEFTGAGHVFGVGFMEELVCGQALHGIQNQEGNAKGGEADRREEAKGKLLEGERIREGMLPPS